MEQARITIDTHTLIWSLDEKLNYKLSEPAKQIILKAETSGIIFIPIIVLLEMLRLIEKGKCNLPFDKIVNGLKNSDSHQIIPFDVELIDVVKTIQGLELHDRLIAATAIYTNSVLVSKDREIQETGLDVIWSATEN
jgi:PIN domain nuclease of toxin-antitoxin system